MRIASETIFRQALTAMQQGQGDLARIQDQLSTGNRLSRAGDDPAAFSTAERMTSRLSALEAFDRAGERARHRLSLGETRLAEVGDLLNRARDINVQANTPVMSPSNRDALRVELVQIRTQLLQAANATDGEGAALFGGTLGAPPAFITAADGSIAYAGDAGSRLISLNDGQTVADGETGPSVFGAAPNDLFAAIDAGLAALSEDDSNARSALTAEALSRMDAAQDTLLLARGRIGARLSAVEQSAEVRAAERLQVETARSTLLDTDIAAAITEFAQAENRLSAAQQSYLRVQQLSLFDLLR